MKFLQRNLMARLMTYFVLLAMLSLVIGFTGYEVARRSIVEQVEAQLDSVATLKEEEVENWVEHLEEYLVWLATTPQIQSHASTLVTQATTTPKYLIAHESLATEFRRAVVLGEVSLVFLLDRASGQVVASSKPSWEGIFRGNEQYFVEGKNRTYISDIFYSLKLDRSTMVISTPVKDSTGQLLAVLVAHANLEWLTSVMLERTGLGETGETYLVNKNNLMLTGSRFIPEAALEHWVFTEGVDQALKGEHGTSFYPDYRGVPIIGAYRWLENMEVALLTEIDQAEAFAPIKALRNTIFGTAGGVMVIVTLLYLLLSRSVSQPIKRLVSATRTIAQGNLNYRVGAIANDEIGELAGAFDQMTARLEEITASRDELDKEIAERKQAEEALKKSEAGLAKAQQIAHLGNFDWNVKDNTSHLSDEYYRIFGLSPHQAGFNYDEFISHVHPDDREFVKRKTGESLYQKTPHSIDYRIILPEGSERTVHSEAEVTFDEAGEPIRLVGIIQDITERRKADEEIRKFKTISDIAGYGVAMTNPKRKITYVNESFAKMHGYRIDELIGKHLSIAYPDEEQEHVKGLIRKMKQASGYRSEEVWHKKKDGSIFPTLMTGIAAMDDKGKPLLLTATTIDITEYKKLEEQIQHSQVLASLGQMTAGIAHEVNNPLGIILLHSELLKESNIPAAEKKDLKVIHNEAKRAAKIMTDLLAYGHKVQPHMRHLDLHKILRKVLDMRRYQEKVQNITVSTEFVERPFYVKVDSSQLTQVFVNLMLNAEEALSESKGGSIAITTRINGEWAKVSIADNGIGIPEENLSQIFHPFFTTKQVGEGTG
ncbi:MAG: PAS domain S-box protein, partial [Dehalococcoidales bacterium]